MCSTYTHSLLKMCFTYTHYNDMSKLVFWDILIDHSSPLACGRLLRCSISLGSYTNVRSFMRPFRRYFNQIHYRFRMNFGASRNVNPGVGFGNQFGGPYYNKYTAPRVEFTGTPTPPPAPPAPAAPAAVNQTRIKRELSTLNEIDGSYPCILIHFTCFVICRQPVTSRVYLYHSEEEEVSTKARR